MNSAWVQVRVRLNTTKRPEEVYKSRDARRGGHFPHDLLDVDVDDALVDPLALVALLGHLRDHNLILRTIGC